MGAGGKITAAQIMALVAAQYHVPVERLTEHGRKREISWPRHMAIYLMRQYTSQSLNRIGWYFGYTDHTSVLHAEREVPARALVDQETREALAALKSILGPTIEEAKALEEAA